MSKICTKCNVSYSLDMFYKDKRTKDGLKYWCKNCSAANRKHNYYKNRLKEKEQGIKYHSTKSGYLTNTYRNMKYRVTGGLMRHLIKYNKPIGSSKYYVGLPILPKEEFMKWAMGDKNFNRLFEQWLASGRDFKLSPSVDRIDVLDGYVLGNMEFVTHSFNSKNITRR